MRTLVIVDGDGDGKGVPFGKAAIVMITSPKRARYKLLTERGAKQLVFPVFSRDEIHDLQRTCFPALSGDTAGVSDRFSRWGGIPRHVLFLTDTENQHLLDAAACTITMDTLAAVLAVQDVTDEGAPQLLFHLKPRGETPDGFDTSVPKPYELRCVELGSPYIRLQVYGNCDFSSHSA